MLVYKPLLKKEKKAQRALLNIDGSKDTHPSLLVKRTIDGEEPSTGEEKDKNFIEEYKPIKT